MILRYQGSALNLWHVLQHADDKTGNCESTNTAIDRLIEASHAEELLDHGSQNWHGWVLVLPFLERLDGHESRVVLKRDIHFQGRHTVNVLDQRDFSSRDTLTRVRRGEALAVQEVSEAVQMARRRILGVSAAEVVLGDEDHVHVGRGEVQSSGIRAEWHDAGIAPVWAHCCVQILEKVAADLLLDCNRLEAVEEVHDFIM